MRSPQRISPNGSEISSARPVTTSGAVKMLSLLLALVMLCTTTTFVIARVAHLHAGLIAGDFVCKPPWATTSFSPAALCWGVTRVAQRQVMRPWLILIWIHADGCPPLSPRALPRKQCPVSRHAQHSPTTGRRRPMSTAARTVKTPLGGRLLPSRGE
jgi:hypothetical protein